MSSIKLTADSGGGTFELKAPSSSGNTRVLTLPDTGNATVLTTDTSVGKLLQVVSTTKTNQFSESIASGATGGDVTGLTVSITPSNASNKILLTCTITVSSTSMGLSFYKAGSILSSAIGDADGSRARVFAEYDAPGGYNMSPNTIHYLDTAGGTSAITYSVRIFNSTAYTALAVVNYNSSGRSALGSGASDYAGVSTITAMEIAA